MSTALQPVALPTTPPKAARRQSSGRRLSGFQDVENLFDENDDESERNKAADQKRVEAEKRKQANSPCLKGTPGHARRLQMYKDCITMTTENKVNEKNAFALDFIDNMGRMLEEKSGDAASGLETDFQHASTALDAASKIYSYRVDSVYTETYKLIGGLTRGGGKKGDSIEEEGEEGEPAEGAAEGDKPARRPARKVATGPTGTLHLETNPAKLNVERIDAAFAVDPLFHRTSAKFDEGGAKGLLLHNLPVRNGCRIVFDSTDATDTAPAPAQAPAEAVPMAALAGLLPANGAEMHVAAEFVALWAQHVPPTGESEAVDAEEPEDEPVDEPEEEPLSMPPMILDENDGGYAPADWEGGGDDSDEEGEVDAKERALERKLGEGEESAAVIMSIDELVDTEVGEAVADDGGGASSEVLNERALKLMQLGQRWAGPGAWKFVRGPGAKGAASGGAEPKKRGAPAKTFLIDFSRRAEAAAALRAAPRDVKATTLTAATAGKKMARAKAGQTTLPTDYHCTVESLSMLFDRPDRRARFLRTKQAVAVRRAVAAKMAAASGAGADAEPIAFPPEEEDGGFAPVDGGFDGGDDDDAFDAFETDQPLAPAPDLDGELVAQPDKVQKIEIGYAKTAKQVDIKGLKNDVWELLCEANAPASDKRAEKVSETVSFQSVLNSLHTKVEATKLPEVSFAYCFISLLHLANENGLAIESDCDMKDLAVSQPPPPAPTKAARK